MPSAVRVATTPPSMAKMYQIDLPQHAVVVAARYVQPVERPCRRAHDCDCQHLAHGMPPQTRIAAE